MNENIVSEIMKNLTLNEKAALVCGGSFFGMAGVPSMNVPDLQLLDGGTGINYEQLFGDIYSKNSEGEGEALQTDLALLNVINYYFEPENLNEKELKIRELIKKDLRQRFIKNTGSQKQEETIAVSGRDNKDLMSPGCFPTGMMLGATWNPEICYEVGRALGREARAYGVNMLLGTPNINIHRDPLNGRMFEGFSEDPALISQLAPEMAKGVQSQNVAANIKHFAANNQESNRQGINEIIPERALMEIYLPGFKACVEKAKPATVMSAYNKINGTPCTENKWLLTEVLRDEWGFDGAVVSDWGAVSNIPESLKAGNDINMPGPVDPQLVIDAINAGQLSEQDLDVNVERVLKLIVNYGLNQKYEQSCQYIMDRSRQAAYKAAVEGIVLLKNERDIFPLATKKGKAEMSDSAFDDPYMLENESDNVILCGSGALKLYNCGTGSAGINTDLDSILYQCLVENGVNTNIGVPRGGVIPENAVVICVVRVNGMEGNDRENMDLGKVDQDTLDRIVELKQERPDIKIGLILNVCGPVDIEKWEPYIDGVMCVFLPGMEGAHALADILTGRQNPSGKLPFSYPKRYKDTPTALNFPGDGRSVFYGEGIYVGYRYYDKKSVEPLYSFGHGLSYSKFKMSNARVASTKQPMQLVDKKGKIIDISIPVFSDTLKLYVDIENIGPESILQGSEVVQVYISDPYSSLPKPVKELKAFKKIKLDAGEKTTLAFELKLQDFASFDRNLRQWTVEEGIYRILIGDSSRNIALGVNVYLDKQSPYSYGPDSTVKEIYENEIIREKLYKLWMDLGLDWGEILSRYQYVSGTLMKEEFVLAKAVEKDTEGLIQKFYNVIGQLKKL